MSVFKFIRDKIQKSKSCHARIAPAHATRGRLYARTDGDNTNPGDMAQAVLPVAKVQMKVRRLDGSFATYDVPSEGISLVAGPQAANPNA